VAPQASTPPLPPLAHIVPYSHLREILAGVATLSVDSPHITRSCPYPSRLSSFGTVEAAAGRSRGQRDAAYELLSAVGAFASLGDGIAERTDPRRGVNRASLRAQRWWSTRAPGQVEAKRQQDDDSDDDQDCDHDGRLPVQHNFNNGRARPPRPRCQFGRSGS
jgi:hypothetical protein